MKKILLVIGVIVLAAVVFLVLKITVWAPTTKLGNNEVRLRNTEVLTRQDTAIKFLGKKIARAGLSADSPSITSCPLEINYRDNRETIDFQEAQNMQVHGFDITMNKCDGEVNDISYATFSLVDTVDSALRERGNYCEFNMECGALKCAEGLYQLCKTNECTCGNL